MPHSIINQRNELPLKRPKYYIIKFLSCSKNCKLKRPNSFVNIIYLYITLAEAGQDGFLLLTKTASKLAELKIFIYEFIRYHLLNFFTYLFQLFYEVVNFQLKNILHQKTTDSSNKSNLHIIRFNILFCIKLDLNIPS